MADSNSTMAEPIHQHWSPSTIVLSYLISVTGSFCTIQLMEQWRQYEARGTRSILLAVAACTLGGCGIWCTHFTGMNALRLTLPDGTVLPIDFEPGFTFLSLVFPIAGVYGGLRIASSDPFFLEIEASRRKALLVKGMVRTKMKLVVNKDKVAQRIRYTALFSRLGRILLGGLLAAVGVLGMHYLGMWAQRTQATMDMYMWVVLLSCVIAFATATAAFWILFRALTFWQQSQLLRVISALIMGVAVCGTHYTGMTAAHYTHTPDSFIDATRYEISGQETSTVASHVAILLCYWLTSLGVTVSVRNIERARSQAATSQHNKNSTYAPANMTHNTRSPSAKNKVFVDANNHHHESSHQDDHDSVPV